MRAREITSESGNDTLIVHDSYGGFIKIRPNPELNPDPRVFSMSYVNQRMAEHYGVNPRLLGFDSHGHRGVPDPHLHGFSRRRASQLKLSPASLAHSYTVLVETFYGLYAALLTKYIKELQNGNN